MKSISKRPLYAVISERRLPRPMRIKTVTGEVISEWEPADTVYAHANCSGQEVCYTCGGGESSRIATVRNGFLRTRGTTHRIIAVARTIGAFVNDSHGEDLSMS